METVADLPAAPWEDDEVLELMWQAFGGKWDDCAFELGYTRESILTVPYRVADRCRGMGVTEKGVDHYMKTHRHKVCLAEALRVVWPNLKQYALADETTP